MGWQLKVLALFVLARCGDSSSSKFSAHKPNRYSSSYSGEYFKDECSSSQLVCVPEEDCVALTPGGWPEGRQCPLNFTPVNGYCIFFGTHDKVYQRSQTQAEDFCTLLDSRSFYFQSYKEWNDLEKQFRLLKVNVKHDEYYWLDAHWEDKTRDRWEWRSTEDEIQWEKILKGTTCADVNLKTIENEKGCLGMHYSSQKKCLLLYNVDCFRKTLFLCKIGIYNSRCSENSDNVCCFSSSYDYYAQNILAGPGTHSTHGESKAECWINIPNKNRLVDCSEALDFLGSQSPLPQPIRIDGSFFYFSRNEPCHGDRLAVVSNPDVHNYIVNYMMTEEKLLSEDRLIIGIEYIAEHDKFKWANGKLLSYYNETHWADGQPNKRSGLGSEPCVAYKKTGINAFSWHLIPTPGCFGPKTMKVCELPIRATNLVPSLQKVECGQRLERGVLAKSSYYDFEYDQAQYGEFPWHAAVVQAQNYHGGIVMLFACSGALVHKDFVLTSAHCVAVTNSDFSVSLGDWDLSDDASHILDTKLIKVADVIMHPGYKATENLKHDIALLRLEHSVDVESLPHIGLGCLPSPELFYQHGGAWECFTIGWPTQSHKKARQILQRVEADLVSKRRCRYFVKKRAPYYYSPRKSSYGSAQYGYDKKYGFHHVSYEQHGYFDSRHPDLFCTEAFESNLCIDDPTTMLVCRKASVDYENPFSSSSDYDYGNYGRSSSNKYHFANTKIINAYGKNRFDSDKWYVMGVGHALSTCGRNHYSNRYNSYSSRYSTPYQIFTPVEDYISFIQSHTDSRI